MTRVAAMLGNRMPGGHRGSAFPARASGLARV